MSIKRKKKMSAEMRRLLEQYSAVSGQLMIEQKQKPVFDMVDEFLETHAQGERVKKLRREMEMLKTQIDVLMRRQNSTTRASL
jgi:hypothetical protein